MVLVIARLVWGLAWSFIRHVGVLEVAAHAPADSGGRVMGFYNGVSRLGSIGGLLGGAALVDAFGYVAAVWMLAGLSLISVLLVAGDRTLRDVPPRAHASSGQVSLDRRGIVELALGFSLGVVGPGFVTSTLGIVLQPYTEQVRAVPGLTAATMTGGLLAVRFLVESVAAPSLGSLSDRWGVRRTATRFFLLGGLSLLAACSEPGSLAILVVFILGFFASSTALQSGIAASVSQRGSAAYARYVTASDVGAAAGPLFGWIAVDLLDYAAIGLMLGGAFYVASSVLCWLRLDRDP
jgi:predicted MFS family arabinose efflux permease